MNGKQAELLTYNSDFDEKAAANVTYFFRCASASAKKTFRQAASGAAISPGAVD